LSRLHPRPGGRVIRDALAEERPVSLSEQKARTARILKELKRLFPEAPCALKHTNPLELLVATVLSAQCTDARVNLVIRDLFRKYRSASDYAGARREDLEADIRSTGFFRSKAKSILGLSEALLRDHGGQVPASMEELVALPGVGRKTANVVLGEGFGITSGIVVDTHVQRISRRLGLTRQEDPRKIESDLMTLVPRKEWIKFGMRMIFHGRGLCPARKPRCGECPLLPHCPFGKRELGSPGSARVRKPHKGQAVRASARRARAR
jgi:endonuclease-3